MNRIIMILAAISIGLCAQANYTVQTSQILPQYPNYQPYQQQYPQVAQSFGISPNQPYAQQYNQGYYQNPYQAQCPSPYVNPYQYQRPYYGNVAPSNLVGSALSGLSTAGGGAPSIMKNIVQSMIFSGLRGY